MNDYGVDWPFWRDDGVAPQGEPQLAERLEAEIRKWAAIFNSEYSHETGWPSAEICVQQRDVGERLSAAIARHPSLGDSVVFAHWETHVAGRQSRRM